MVAKIIKQKKLIISVLVTGVFLYLLYYFIDFKTFIDLICTVNIRFILVSVLVTATSYIVRAYRFEMILLKKNLFTFFSISSIHFFLNKILPARSGEISMPILFHKYLNVSYKKGTSALVLFRFLDLLSVLLLLAISLVFIKVEKLNQLLLISIALAIIVLQVLLWMKFNWFIGLLEKVINMIKLKKIEKYKDNLQVYFKELIQYRESKTGDFFIKIMLITILNWFLIYLTFYFIVLSFHLQYSIVQVIFATSLANFSMLIPISAIGGFGTFEAGWSVGFVLLGMPLETAISIGLFTNIFGLIVSGAFASFGYVFLMKPLQSKNSSRVN